MNARDRILDAADDLFGKVGFNAATTREIAEASGVNKALIHYHFKTKEVLFETLLDRYYESLGATLSGALQGDSTLKERMSTLVDTYMDFLDRNRNFSRIVQREASGGPHMERIRVRMIPLFEMGMRHLNESYPQTRSGELSATQILISFYGMIISYFTYKDVLQHLLGVDPLSKKGLKVRKEHLQRMVEITLGALEQG